MISPHIRAPLSMWATPHGRPGKRQGQESRDLPGSGKGSEYGSAPEPLPARLRG